MPWSPDSSKFLWMLFFRTHSDPHIAVKWQWFLSLSLIQSSSISKLQAGLFVFVKQICPLSPCGWIQVWFSIAGISQECWVFLSFNRRYCPMIDFGHTNLLARWLLLGFLPNRLLNFSFIINTYFVRRYIETSATFKKKKSHFNSFIIKWIQGFFSNLQKPLLLLLFYLTLKLCPVRGFSNHLKCPYTTPSCNTAFWHKKL